MRGEPDGTDQRPTGRCPRRRPRAPRHPAGRPGHHGRRSCGRPSSRIDPPLLPLLPLLGTVAHVDDAADAGGRRDRAPVPADQLPASSPASLERGAAQGAVASWSRTPTGPTPPPRRSCRARSAVAGPARRRGRSVVVRRDVRRRLRGRQARLLRVGPLGRPEHARARSPQSPRCRCDPTRSSDLVSRAAGSPLVLHALAAAGPGAGRRRPARLARGPDRGRDRRPRRRCPACLLDYASVLGRSFNPRSGEDLLAEDGLEVDDSSRDELERFLDFDGAGGARFRQAVVRDVGLRRAPVPPPTGAPPPCRRGHRAARRRRRRLRSPTSSSLHFYGGGRRRAGVAVRAASPPTTPEAAFANDEAAALYRRALDAGRRLEASTATEHRSHLDGARGRPGAGGPASTRRWTPTAGRPRSWATRSAGPGRASCSSGPASASGPARSSTALARRHASPSGCSTDGSIRRRRHGSGRGGDAAGDRPRRPGAAAARPGGGRAGRRRGRQQLGELRELARALSVIDWAHVELGEPDLAVHERRHRRDLRVAGRAAPGRRRARQPGGGALLARALERGARLLPTRRTTRTSRPATSSTPPSSRPTWPSSSSTAARSPTPVRWSSRRPAPIGRSASSTVPLRRDPGRTPAPRRGRRHGRRSCSSSASCGRRRRARPRTPAPAGGDPPRRLPARPRAARWGPRGARRRRGERGAGRRAPRRFGGPRAVEGARRGRAMPRASSGAVDEGVAAARRMGLRYELGLLLLWHDDPALREEGRPSSRSSTSSPI